MATYLKPDRIRTEKVSTGAITIKEKIIPDNARATKNVAPWCKTGQPMKPCAKLNDSTGKPRGITIHNTVDIKTAPETNPAEQYSRATWPNCNMSGVVVHFYVYGTEIWQNLREDERGWHASDGQTRRASQRKGMTICGNTDTIAIECIGNGNGTEDTVRKLTAYLLYKYGLSPDTDVYTHNFFMGRGNSIVPGASKNCPIYILPHWTDFLKGVKAYYSAMVDAAKKPTTPTPAKPPVVIPPAPKPPAKPVLKAGTKITLNKASLYLAAASSKKIRSVSGHYWRYDDAEINGRIRVTNSEKRVGKKPLVLNVTGWIDKPAIT